MTPEELQAAGFSGAEIQDYFATQAPEARSPIADTLAQALGGAGKGVSALGGLITDVATLPAKAPIPMERYLPKGIAQSLSGFDETLGINKPFGYYTNAMQETVGEPFAQMVAGEPKGITQKYAEKLGEFAPATALGPASLGTKLLMAALGAGGSTVAREISPESDMLDAGLSMAAPSIPSALRGASSGVKALMSVLPSQIERRIGQVVKETGVTAPKLAAAAKLKASGDVYDRLATTSELTGNPGLSSLESTSMRMNPGEAALLESRKRGAFTKALDDISPAGNIPEQQLGETVSKKVSDSYFKTRNAGGKLFGQIDPEGTTAIPVQGIRRQLQKEASVFGDAKRGSYLPLRGDAKTFIKGFLDDSKPSGKGAVKFTFDKLHKIRMDAQELAAKLDAGGKTGESRVLKQFVRAIDSTLESSAKKGVGFTAEQAAKFKAANKFWKEEVIKAAEPSVIGQSILAGRTEAEFIPQKLMTASTPALRRIKKSLSEKEVQDVRANLFDKIRWNVTSATDQPTLAGMQGTLAKNHRVVKTFFEPKHLRSLERIEQVLKRQATTRELAGAASKGNSITSQALTNVEALKSLALQGALDNIPVAGGAFRTIRKYVTSPEQAELVMNRVLMRVATDPGYASQLLRKADQSSIRNLTEAFGKALMENNMLQNALINAQGAATSGALGE